MATRSRIYSFDEMDRDGRPAWSLNERRIAFAKGTELIIAATQSGEFSQRIAMPLGPLGIRGTALGPGWSPDGTLIATGVTWSVGLMVFKVETGQCVFARPTGSWLYSAVFSPNGRTLAWCGEQGVELVDTAAWTNIHTIPVPRPAQQIEQGWLAFSPDGATLALGYGRDSYLIDPLT